MRSIVGEMPRDVAKNVAYDRAVIARWLAIGLLGAIGCATSPKPPSPATITPEAPKVASAPVPSAPSSPSAPHDVSAILVGLDGDFLPANSAAIAKAEHCVSAVPGHVLLRADVANESRVGPFRPAERAGVTDAFVACLEDAASNVVTESGVLAGQRGLLLYARVR